MTLELTRAKPIEVLTLGVPRYNCKERRYEMGDLLRKVLTSLPRPSCH